MLVYFLTGIGAMNMRIKPRTPYVKFLSVEPSIDNLT